MALPRDTIGAMRRRLRIEQNAPIDEDGFNQLEARWKPVLNTPDTCVWAEIEDFSGREYFNAAQVQADVDCRIRLRNFDGTTITPDMRAVDPHDDDQVYEFISVRWLDGRRTMLEIMARRTVTNPLG